MTRRWVGSASTVSPPLPDTLLPAAAVLTEVAVCAGRGGRLALAFCSGEQSQPPVADTLQSN
ncbi:hypothetical protein OUHCRE3_57690 [Enterobacter hormaechei]